ncbi:MAG: 50S ribosomal protein L18 [Bacteroidota bacterium]
MASIRKKHRRERIKYRIRKTISGTAERPRLTVFKSNKQIYAQLIDDLVGHTLIATSSRDDKSAQNIPKIEQAKIAGKSIAEKAIKSGITNVVFDRNGYLYHGRVKTLAEAAREAGLKY